MAIFPGELGLLKELVLTAGAIRHAKLQSDHHHQQINTLGCGSQGEAISDMFSYTVWQSPQITPG